MAFKLAEVYKDITKSYILESLNHQYRGKGYKFSDDLLTILESDFKRKARNLDWLFQGKTRIALQPSAESLFQSLQDNRDATDFITIAKAYGYTVDAQNFTSGYIVIDKQQVKFHKVVEIMSKLQPPELPEELVGRLIEQRLVSKVNKYRPEMTLLSSNLHGIGSVYSTHKKLCIAIHSNDSVTKVWTSSRFIDVDRINKLLNSSEVIMSLDINDYITCSEGSFTSCMSMNSGSSRHLGWMMHFRSDFSVITFTHKKGESFYKTGRTWTFIKLTEDGRPYPRPFYKLSRVYGELNASHVTMVDTHIQDSITKNLNLGNPKKHTDSKIARFGELKTIVSPNMQNTDSYYVGNGYFDWPGDSTTVWSRLPLWEYNGIFPVTPFTQEVYSKGPVCILNFPDALDVFGNPTNKPLFENDSTHSHKTCFGWNEHYKQFVTCQATGVKTLLRDALEVTPGIYVHKDHAISVLSGKTMDAITVPVTEVTISTPQTIELSDDDIIDF